MLKTGKASEHPRDPLRLGRSRFLWQCSNLNPESKHAAGIMNKDGAEPSLPLLLPPQPALLPEY